METRANYVDRSFTLPGGRNFGVVGWFTGLERQAKGLRNYLTAGSGLRSGPRLARLYTARRDRLSGRAK